MMSPPPMNWHHLLGYARGCPIWRPTAPGKARSAGPRATLCAPYHRPMPETWTRKAGEEPRSAAAKAYPKQVHRRGSIFGMRSTGSTTSIRPMTEMMPERGDDGGEENDVREAEKTRRPLCRRRSDSLDEPHGARRRRAGAPRRPAADLGDDEVVCRRHCLVPVAFKQAFFLK